MPSLAEFAEKNLSLALQAAKISGLYSKQDPNTGFQTLKVKAVENMGGGINPKTGALGPCRKIYSRTSGYIEGYCFFWRFD